jgi:subtilisin family serine protease
VTAVAALIAALAGPSASGAAPGARQFRKAPDIRVQPGAKPMSMRAGTVTVMIQMRGAPVAVLDAAAGGKLSKARKDSLRASLRAAQQPVAVRAQQLGARVDHAFQLAYNGIQVRIPASRIPALGAIRGVQAVHVMRPQSPDNVQGIPFMGVPSVWGGVPGHTGSGVKIGIIDTGIDYTHADFGGPGTVAAYNAAHAAETSPPNPAYVGPGAARIKGGVDLVGDGYDAGAGAPSNVPAPDPNPIDCGGHGTHVAGTAAGSGVLSDGTSFSGPYDAATISAHTWKVGPGSAPQADIYAIKVFGCVGSTNETVHAIEWAVANDMDVINMSLGSSFGGADDPSAVAASNAALGGMVVVASAGNSGDFKYITGSPASGNGVLSVAANDGRATLAGANLTLSTGPVLPVFRANPASTNAVGTVPIKVLFSSPGVVSLGCNLSDYTSAGVAGKIAVVKRGVCARVQKAQFGQNAGAVAVVMINDQAGYPPFEGNIPGVTIPFLGALTTQQTDLVAADGGTGTPVDAAVPNPTQTLIAGFSSSGARYGDSWLKPNVTAPGVLTLSAGVGTGTEALELSGTSMASPGAAGIAALVRQAHPGWTQTQVRAAMVNTSDPSLVAGPYAPLRSGAGEVQAPPAVHTDVVAFGPNQETALNFGYLGAASNLSLVKKIKVVNDGASAVKLTIGTRLDGGRPHSIVAPSQVTIAGHHSKSVKVTLNVPAATAGNSSAYRDVFGQITFTPAAGQNGDIALAVPYYLVTQANSKINSTVAWGTPTSGTATTTNTGGAVSGTSDWYAWGLHDGNGDGGPGADLRSVGVQSLSGGSILVFALNSWKKWSSTEFTFPEVHVDVGDDGTEDYIVLSEDLAYVVGGGLTGEIVTFVYDTRTGSISADFDSDIDYNARSVLMPIDTAQLCEAGSACLNAGNPRFSYTAVWYDRAIVPDAASGEGHFNPFTPAISNGISDTVAPGGSANNPVSINAAERALTPFLGLMVVASENALPAQAQLITVP